MALTARIELTVGALRLDLALAVESEPLAVVGRSGAGKTTLLAALAGLRRPDRGRVELAGRVLLDTEAGVDVPVERRRIGLLFQEYALFPHLSVRDNVAFGGGGVRVDELIDRFGLARRADARPGELSGGERQRVALARALAAKPQALLLDEPTAALDAHTRDGVRSELRELLRELSLPVVLVTHDFEEAAALAGRVAVIEEGRLLQEGEPGELLAAPASPFVASFVGSNVLIGVAAAAEAGLTRIALEDGTAILSVDTARGPVAVIVHPWDVAVARRAGDDSALNRVAGPIGSLVPLGNRVRVRVRGLVGEITAASAQRLELALGEEVVLAFKATATRLLPLGSETGAVGGSPYTRA